jgi:hypothetical protein
MSDETPLSDEPTDNLSELATMMLRALYMSPASAGVRVVVMLDDGRAGTIAIVGYEDGDVPAAVIADISQHAAHFAASYGLPLVLGIGPREGTVHESADAMCEHLAELTDPTFDMEVEMSCLAHREVVRWLAAPMWWYHVRDNRTCVSMTDVSAPRVLALRLR